jgi:hypothetical protein
LTERIDHLYERLLDDNPAKPGTKYERLTAIVAKVLDRSAVVVHDVRLRGDGKLTSHQIDVQATGHDGASRRALFECRDYDTDKIDLDQVRSFATVVRQLQPDSAWMITTVGFTEGARTCAMDEGIGLALLHPATPEDMENVVRRVVTDITTVVTNPTVRVLDVRLTDATVRELQAAGVQQLDLTLAHSGYDEIADESGTLVEPWGAFLGALIEEHGGGVGKHVATLAATPPRVLLDQGRRLVFDQITIEYEVGAVRFRITHELLGSAVAELALRAIVGDGLPTRVFYAHDLVGLTLDEEGRVVLRPGGSPRPPIRRTVEDLPPLPSGD